MARMRDGMERLLRGEAPPPADGGKVAAHGVSTCMILRGAAAEGH